MRSLYFCGPVQLITLDVIEQWETAFPVARETLILNIPNEFVAINDNPYFMLNKPPCFHTMFSFMYYVGYRQHL
jgi:hypothetical protein